NDAPISALAASHVIEMQDFAWFMTVVLPFDCPKRSSAIGEVSMSQDTIAIFAGEVCARPADRWRGAVAHCAAYRRGPPSHDLARQIDGGYLGSGPYAS